jgi:hypothetical protein
MGTVLFSASNNSFVMKAILGTDCLQLYSSPFVCRYRYSVLLENHSYLMLLQVHGLLHLFGFDHELSEDAEAEMEKEEELLLKSLGWKGKGLIHSAYDAENNANSHKENTDGNFCLSVMWFQRSSFENNLTVGFSKDRKKEGSLRFYKPKFNYIFCDMDGEIMLMIPLHVSYSVLSL